MAKSKGWLQTRAEYALAATLLYGLEHLPLRSAWQLSNLAVRLLDRGMPKLRRAGLINLGFAFPDLDSAQHNQILDGVFRSIARLLVAMARFPQFNVSNVTQWISYEGLEHYLAAKKGGRGVLVATAHLGNWELSAFAHALLCEPMNVLIRPLDNPLIDQLVEQRRTMSGNRLIYKWDAARVILKALKSNEAVGILIDQNTTPAEGVFVNFFGKLACAGSAFAKLAQHSGATVIPGFALWDESRERYTLRFYPPIPMTGDVQEDTQKIHAIFESIIREHPDQWMWIHRRWKTRPFGEGALYS